VTSVFLILASLVPSALAAPALPSADQQRGPILVPIVGRPGYFNESVGTRFEVTMRASRTELHAMQQLTLTVRVTAVGRYWQPPERPNLEELAKFNERFKIDRPANSKPDRVLADQRSWEFEYKLRPRPDVTVERIPPLPFVWYRPSRKANLRGYFATTFGEEIELKVKPVPVVTPMVKQVPIQAPESFFAIAAGPAVLERDEPYRLPSLGLWALLLLAPPALAGAWFVIWRRLYPDAARLARIRQSRAAIEALRALVALGTVDESLRVARITAISANYLRYRFDLRAIEPTPAEVGEHLRRAGASDELAEQAADFFRACDAARFAPVEIDASGLNPGARPDDDLAGAAQRLITALEAQPWSRLS
jgi:hypothetical protein